MEAKGLKQLSLSILFTFCLLSLSLCSPDSAALLAFKFTLDPSNSLSSWSNVSSDGPCSWLGVTCNPSTRRVAKLVLNNLNLTGYIHPLSQLTHLRHLSLHHNRLSSAATLDLSSWPNLKHLFLSHNRLAGRFPVGISLLHRLHRLDLSYNQFTGAIPVSELTRLPRLLTLRLEFNSFTGSLSSDELSSVSISDFNVSGNDLAGQIPDWLSRFPATSFAGNNKLCGNPLPSICQNPTAGRDSVQNTSSTERKRHVNDRMVLTIIAIDAVAVIAIVILVTCCCYIRSYRHRERKNEEKRNHYYRSRGRILERESGGGGMVFFEGCKGFSKVDDLLKASAEMLGKGSVGTTYKVVMDGGDVMVVKRVRERKLRKEFDGILRDIGGVRHHNIVSLRAYYSSKDELLLVSDFLPNGSLHSLLHGNRGPGRTPLDWTTRLKLASGSAQGLAFLHSHNKSKLFHGQLTSSNIIVDHMGNPCFSDIGLFQLFQTPAPSSNAHKAPELVANSNSNNSNSIHNPKFMQRCDVYSFGVVLLEILTGKMATGEGETGLVKWVERAAHQENCRRWEVFDFELVRYKEMEEEMAALLEVALLCLTAAPRDRPKMGVVCQKIEEIRAKGGGGRVAESPLIDHHSDSSPALSESTPNFTSS